MGQARRACLGPEHRPHGAGRGTWEIAVVALHEEGLRSVWKTVAQGYRTTALQDHGREVVLLDVVFFKLFLIHVFTGHFFHFLLSVGVDVWWLQRRMRCVVLPVIVSLIESETGAGMECSMTDACDVPGKCYLLKFYRQVLVDILLCLWFMVMVLPNMQSLVVIPIFVEFPMAIGSYCGFRAQPLFNSSVLNLHF
uniref:Uncharacterized protein n=1 Tax=Arundo donax TaxID=35708 RepID=A0A0A9C8T7_ARUDO